WAASTSAVSAPSLGRESLTIRTVDTAAPPPAFMPVRSSGARSARAGPDLEAGQPFRLLVVDVDGVDLGGRRSLVGPGHQARDGVGRAPERRLHAAVGQVADPTAEP